MKPAKLILELADLGTRFSSPKVVGNKPWGMICKVSDSERGNAWALLRLLVHDDSREGTSVDWTLSRLATLVEQTVDIPNLFAYYSFGELQVEDWKETAIYLVRPHADKTLESVLLRETLTADTALATLQSTAEGLAELHRLGHWHGDVRTANVFHEGHTDRWLLGDYGIWGHLRGPHSTSGSDDEAGQRLKFAEDVYAFGILTEQLLGYLTKQSTSERRLTELVAACTQVDYAKRPAASAVRDYVIHGWLVLRRELLSQLQSGPLFEVTLRRVIARLEDNQLVVHTSLLQRAHQVVEVAARVVAEQLSNSPALVCRLYSREALERHLVAVADLAITDPVQDNLLLGAGNLTEDRVAEETSHEYRNDLNGFWLERIRASMSRFVETAEVAKNDPNLPAEVRKRFDLTPQDIVARYDHAVRSAASLRRTVLEQPTFTREQLRGVVQHKVAIPDLVDLGMMIELVDDERTLYPAFQFDLETGLPLQTVCVVNQILKARDDPWGVAAWWASGSVHLDDQSPVELLSDTRNSNRIVAAAQRHTERDL